jgi:choline dehydrogenase-like flavoprotein
VGALVLAPRKSSNNWGLATIPDPGLSGRSDYHPLGRGLGGGTSINMLMYMRGHRRDYDGWAALGNPGWGYDDVLPYFRRSENNQTHRNAYHGNDGPVWVEELRTDNPYHRIVADACREVGWPHNPDFNGATQEGFNTVQVMMRHGERVHAGMAYVHPHLGARANLTLHCETHCTRILFEGRRAIGIEVVHAGERRILRAAREVIVAGGGILSAKLLLLSGVGDGAQLQRFGIAQVQQLPAVGRNLQDHVDVILGHHVPGDPNLLGISPTGAVSLLRAWRRWRKERRGMLATNFAEITGFMSLTPESRMPEIQYEFVFALAMDHGREVYWKHGISTHVLLLHPKSRGEVRLASGDWRDDPVIDFRYFSHEDDVTTMVEGVKRTIRVFDTPALRSRVKRDLLTADCRTDADWERFCRRVAGTNYHPVGSCGMGPDPATAVVDARLRVHGLEGLRVVDSSIMPTICGGNTTAPSYMIGEKGADMIRQDWR